MHKARADYSDDDLKISKPFPNNDTYFDNYNYNYHGNAFHQKMATENLHYYDSLDNNARRINTENGYNESSDRGSGYIIEKIFERPAPHKYEKIFQKQFHGSI